MFSSLSVFILLATIFIIKAENKILYPYNISINIEPLNLSSQTIIKSIDLMSYDDKIIPQSNISNYNFINANKYELHIFDRFIDIIGVI